MNTDITPVSVDLYFIPIETRIPFKFGHETMTSVICARVCVTAANRQGQRAQGWGETPLSVQWVWPSSLEYQERCETMKLFSQGKIYFDGELKNTSNNIELLSTRVSTTGWMKLKEICRI